jgi:pimeloyl-ACP methyl ester carboxylesterase
MDKVLERTDFQLTSSRGLPLSCSHYFVRGNPRLVIFLHGNSGSRLDCVGLVRPLLEAGYNLLCWDFAGCGHSGGERVAMGLVEKYDLAVLV